MANRSRHKKKRHTGLWIAFFIFLIVFGSVGYIGYYFIYMPTKQSQDFHSYFELDPALTTLIVQDTRLDGVHPIEREGEIYFPLGFIQEHIDPTIYWDAISEIITITTEDKVLRMMVDAFTYTQNDRSVSLDAPITLINNEVYIPSGFLAEFYPFRFEYNGDYRIVTMDLASEIPNMALIKEKTAAVRYKPSKKALVETELTLGDKVNVYQEEEGYTRVRTAAGLLGYVLTSEMTPLVQATPTEAPPENETSMPFTPRKPIKGKINMVFDQMMTVDDSIEPERYYADADLDVLAPTWFSFDITKLNGDIVSIANKEYVDWAHSKGYQVWGLLSDFSSDTDIAFNQDVTQAVLSLTNTRAHVIRQIIELITEYDLDGINIDFEYLQPENAAVYVQFFRELSPYMKAIGKTLSVDMYTPVLPDYWSQYYNRKQVGKCVDYIIIMAYDEHTNGTDSGPVASLPFVNAGVLQTISEVPPEKVILGLPYWVRVWREVSKNGEVQTSLRNYDMQAGNDIFAARGVDLTWDSGVGSSYGEYVENEGGAEVTYRVWLEDERSIEEKMKILQKHRLAGVAGWKRGLEKQEVWQVLRKYLQ